MKLVICINPGAAEFEENLNVLSFAEAANSIVCKREAPIAEFDIQEMVAKAAEKEKKNRRRTIHEAWKGLVRFYLKNFGIHRLYGAYKL